MSKEKLINARVYLRYDIINPQGEIVPAGTIGTVTAIQRGVPQVSLGPKHGIRATAPHALAIIDVPDGAPLPADGTLIEIEDLLATIAALSWDLHCTQLRLARELRQAVQFGGN